MIKFAMTIIYLCLVSNLLQTTSQAGDSNETIASIRWGQHWAGPELDPAALKGKVVLLKIWGG